MVGTTNLSDVPPNPKPMKSAPSRAVSRALSLKPIVTSAFLGCLALLSPAASAQVNILLVGSTAGTGSNSWTSDATARPFNYTDVRTHLAGMLQAANMGTVNVALEDRYRMGSDDWGTKYSYNLLSWFHWPYPANDEVNNRWPSLRNQGSTAWDHVVLIEDSYTVERTPGLYAQAVAMIGEEVEKAGKKPLLLMTWPGSGSTSTIAHYKEVNFRIGPPPPRLRPDAVPTSRRPRFTAAFTMPWHHRFTIPASLVIPAMEPTRPRPTTRWSI